jgi:hypothetical protein
VQIDINRGRTPKTGAEVGVTNISDKKGRLRQERDMKGGTPNSRDKSRRKGGLQLSQRQERNFSQIHLVGQYI